MASISIRERMLKDGKARLILNFYLPGGKRKTEKLDLTIVKKPTTREEREANKTVKQLADRIRAKRLLEIQNKRYGFTDTQKLQSSFPDYFKKEVEKRRRTGSYGNWQSTYQVLLKFLDNKDLAFEDVDTTFLEKFKKYLLEARITKSNEKLARNSALSYFNKVKAALNQAFDDKIIQDRVGQRVKSIKEQDTHREYLTVEELKKLINTDCESELLKRAFLFSAATGLRWSDVNALTWANVEYSDELKCHQLRFVQQKTKGSEILPISDQALDFIGERSKDDERLHSQLEFLVCQVWCNANDNDTCESLLQPDFEIIYNSYGWLKAEVDAVYEACKVLIPEQRADIRSAFSINNRIEELCENVFRPIDLDDLPNVVTSLMKPLLEKFYTRLLGLAGVVGNKLDYYNSLINRNDFKTCPCCGLSIIESAESHYREDNDHYLPKAEFPFAVVNFKNLVPLCGKCNKKCKGTKNPFEPGRVSFYPFSNVYNEIAVEISIVDSVDLDYRDLRIQDIQIQFDSDVDKTATWDWLFNITERYNEQVRHFTKTELRTVANRLLRNRDRKLGLTYEQIIDDTIEDFEIEKFEDRKFLKASLLQAIKNKPEWMAVYVN